MNMSISVRVNGFRQLLENISVTDGNNMKLDLEHGMESLCTLLLQVKETGSRLYVIGNGGSAGVAGHAVTDFFNMAGIRAMTLHESSLLTCMSNDYGYENAFARMLEQMVQAGDIVIVISSSGQSMNMRNAARCAAENGAVVVTLSGFDSDNPLRTMGKLNIWLDSHDYGMIEIGHQFILHNISDRLRDIVRG